MPKRACVAVVVGVVVAGATSGSLHAWGVQGHRLVALVAVAHLSPAARQGVKWLLPDRTLDAVASWADDYRVDHHASAPWHYVNPPLDATSYVRDRDCPRQPGVAAGSRSDRWRDCVVDRILYNQQLLADIRADRADRATALKFLVHFVGDLHQPMHALITGRGGNDVPVVAFGSSMCQSSAGTTFPCNLHGLWDTGLIAHRALSDAQYANELTRVINTRKLDMRPQGGPAEWAMESLRLARAAMLPANGAADETYYQAQIGVVDERLALGGLRLAAILNQILTVAPPR